MIPTCEAQFYLESRGEIDRESALPSGNIVAVVLFGNCNEQNNSSSLRGQQIEHPKTASAYICSVAHTCVIKSRHRGTATRLRLQSEGQLILRYSTLSRIDIPIFGEGSADEILGSLQQSLSNTIATLDFYVSSGDVKDAIKQNIETCTRCKGQYTKYVMLQKPSQDNKISTKGCVFSLSPKIIAGHVQPMSTPDRIPIPLLSISLEQTNGRKILASDDNSRDVLLQQCLKRLMIGTIVVCPMSDEYIINCDGSCGKNGFSSSAISLKVPSIQNALEESFEYKVSSVLPHLQASRGSKLANYIPNIFLILPSTRITLVHPNAESESETAGHAVMHTNTTVCESMPGTEELILNTINCIRHYYSSVFKTKPSSLSRTAIDVPRAFLLSGPPGVGKTYAVRMAVEASNAQGGTSSTRLISIRGSEILSAGANEADAALELKRVIMSAAEFASKDFKNISLIFMDECDALLSSDVAGSTLAYLLDQMSSHVVNTADTMLKTNSFDQIGWKRVIVIAATNRIDSVPSSLRRPGRFDRELSISPPNKEQRFNILSSLICKLELNNQHHTMDISIPAHIDSNELQEVADLCVGYVAADLSALVRRAAFLSIQEGLTHISCAFLKLAMSAVGASALRDSAINAPPSTRWDDIAGDAGGAKTALRHAVEWPQTKKKDFERLGLAPPRGILLHGPPGCAKTTLARAAAGAAGVAFLSLSPADVYASSYVGEAEAVVRRAFSLARSASPCILFFDEIDSIVATSSSNTSGMERGNNAEARVLSTFLNEMDGVDGSISDGVLVLGATNRPGTLDSALLRPGRFDKVIYVPNPDREGRKSILDAQCRLWERNGAVCDINTIDLSSDDITGMMTGAEIVGACREAAMLAIRESLETEGQGIPVVLQRHLETSLSAVKPLLSNACVLLEYTSFEDEHSK